MSIQGMIDNDLAACFNLGEFADEATHFYGVDSTESLNIIFDETTDVILDKGEYAGIEATVPSLQVSTILAVNINHKSLFTINGFTYSVIEVHKQNDSTTKVYLEKE